MKPGRLLTLSALIGAGYWLYKYLQPSHSVLTLNNSVVVITGASAGIGRAYANAFARRGARLVLAARRADLLEEVRSEVEPYAAAVLVVPTDVQDDESLAMLVQKTIDQFGQVDVLVNNAGILLEGHLQRFSSKEIRRLIDVNLGSMIALTGMVLPHMLSQRRGWVVNISSVASQAIAHPQIVYTASKFGVRGFSKALRQQTFGTGVHVLHVMPSFTETDMVRPELERIATMTSGGLDSPSYIAERTIDAMLRGKEEVLFGGAVSFALAFLQRHFPMLSSWMNRYVFTPNLISDFDPTIKSM
jgi:short-subunit dehydrogenase